MNKFIKRFAIFVFSLFLFLIGLEVSLRIIGQFQIKKILSPHIHENNYDYKILCIGDSYTVGGSVVWEESYPYLLQEVLSKTEKKNFEVINGGRCEINSTQALWTLKELTRVYNPDCVILLIGSANRFNLYGYHCNRRKNILPEFKVYKMFTILVTNLKGAVLRWKVRHHRIKNNSQIIDTSDVDIDDLSFEPNDPQGYCKLGRYYLETRRFKDAEHVFRKAIEMDPNLAEAYAGLGHACNWQGRYKEAADIFKKALELNPYDDGVYNGLGSSYKQQGKYKEAEAMFKKAIEINPENINAYIDLGYFYNEFRRYRQAAEVWKKLIQLKPDDDRLYVELGNAYQRLEQFDQAIKMYRKAIEINPYQSQAYTELGNISICHGDYDKGMEFLFKAIEIDSSKFINYYFLTRAYELQNKYDSEYVLKIFENMVERHPELKKNKLFMNNYDFFKNREIWEQRIDDWLRNDLEQIVKFCKQKNITLIVQNYPYPYLKVNKILKEIADKYNLPFVDNYSIFSKLVAQNGEEKYFTDYDHCTLRGHKIMVQNIYKTLVVEGIVEGNLGN